MSQKEKTIAACEELVRKYRDPAGEEFCRAAACPLCVLHFRPRQDPSCTGCPLTYVDGDSGCGTYSSYEEIKGHVNANWTLIDRPEALYAANRRAGFFETLALPIIKDWPEERFTADGWQYHDFGKEN